MAGRLNRPAAADGVIAYQDYDNSEVFHYFLLRIDAVSGETIKSFKVDYYGINAKPYWVDLGGGDYQSVVGGNLSGNAIPDITAAQRANIIKRIGELYGVKNPNLTPLVINNVEVQPIFAKHIVGMGTGNSATFPNKVTVGGSFGYQVGSGNSLFAELVGSERDDTGPQPDFAVNIYGQAELYADPWVAEIHADLKRVWEYTRTQVNVGVNIGWFDIGVNIDKITQELIAKGIVTMKFRQGGGGSEFGWQMLNSTKSLFEAINKQVAGGEGAAAIHHVGQRRIQQRVLQPGDHLRRGGDFRRADPGAVHRRHVAGPAVRDEQKRIATEAEAKRVILVEDLAKVRSGQWTPQQYAAWKEVLNSITLTESPAIVGTNDDGTPIIECAPPEVVKARLDQMREALTGLPEPRAPRSTATPRRIKV